MASVRMLIVSLTAVLGGSVLLLGGCGGNADSACKSVCDKQYSCGDIDSVKADQCRNKCDGDADQTQAELDKCSNESDILSAIDQCVGRDCSDYAKCLTTLPSCEGGGTPTGGGGGGMPAGNIACDESSNGLHLCVEIPSTASCPQGTNSVAACSTAGLLGISTDTSGSLTEREFFYAGGGITASTAQMSCQSAHGSWSGG
jgi:hypothetical protein